MKKIVCNLISIIIIITLSIQVSAHHNKNGRNAISGNSHTVCNLENCVKSKTHIHESKSYSAHYYSDGHDYHDYCIIQDCAIIGYHEHEGAYYFQHTINDGHDYHDYCEYSDCTYNTYHEHEGVYCFAYQANKNQNYRSTRTCHR